MSRKKTSRPDPSRSTPFPRAAQRWLDNAVPEGTQRPARVVVGQHGTMDAQGRWLSFKSQGEYGVEPLSFDWRARLSLKTGIWLSIKDGHADGEGWGGSWLWGIKKMGERSGPEVLLTQVIRNIAELVWLPDLATADGSLTWADAGADAFEIRRRVSDRDVAVRFEVDAEGDVTSARCPARPFDVPDGFDEAPWRCDFGGHRDFDGIRLPDTVVATYELEDGPWEYFRAEVDWVTRSTHQV